MSLVALPTELYSTILSHVSPTDSQAVTLNLSRAIPISPVPLQSLFEHVVISRQQQVPQLYRRLCFSQRVLETIGDAPKTQEAGWIRSFTMRTWQVDADVLVNLLAILPAVERLSLMLGTVFAPEHLENLFRKPAPLLNTLSLRFRPYVQRATYYQFLKGSYFDSTMELISSWPCCSALSYLSIIQDPLPSHPAEVGAKPFAQPIVFFSLTPITSLSLSPATQHVTHLRLRVPCRQLVRFLTPYSPSTVSPFPALIHLDLSTTVVRDMSDIEALLNYVGRGELRHLVLDKTGLCNGSDGEWETLGRTCALAGVKRAREREKLLKAQTEAEAAARARAREREEAVTTLLVPAERRPRRGRRGLATATISLRDTPAVPDLPVLLTISPSPKATKIRVLPPPPRLLSLSTTLPQSHSTSAHDTKARSDFAKGWTDGLSQLRATWTRLRQSQANGIARVVRFGGTEQGWLAGLEELGCWEEVGDGGAPVLCFAGTRGDGHVDGCGHHVASDVWGDDL